jgi:RNase P subunit RPR2
MAKQFSRKKHNVLENKEIAKERIKILFSKIRENPSGKYSPRYVKLIFAISRKYRVPKPSRLIKRHCPDCFRYLVIGKTARIRIKKGQKKLICACSKSF